MKKIISLPLPVFPFLCSLWVGLWANPLRDWTSIFGMECSLGRGLWNFTDKNSVWAHILVICRRQPVISSNTSFRGRDDFKVAITPIWIDTVLQNYFVSLPSMSEFLCIEALNHFKVWTSVDAFTIQSSWPWFIPLSQNHVSAAHIGSVVRNRPFSRCFTRSNAIRTKPVVVLVLSDNLNSNSFPTVRSLILESPSHVPLTVIFNIKAKVFLFFYHKPTQLVCWMCQPWDYPFKRVFLRISRIWRQSRKIDFSFISSKHTFEWTYSRKNSLKFPRFILRAKFRKDRNLHVMAVFAA